MSVPCVPMRVFLSFQWRARAVSGQKRRFRVLHLPSEDVLVAHRIPSGNSNTKHSLILNDLRQRIFNNVYQPGHRLPTRDDLQAEFSVSRQTIQNVFDELIEHGWVVSSGRRGTHVATHPPHLHHYALVFPYSPENWSGWTHLWRALRQVAQDTVAEGHARFFHVYGDRSHTADDSYDGLIRMIDACGVSGAIFVMRPRETRRRVIDERPHLPVVAFSDQPVDGITSLHLDHATFYEQAVTQAAARGRRRIAFIVPAGLEEKYDRTLEHITRLMREAGVTYRSSWLQSSPPLRPDWAMHAAELLVSGAADERPDALIVGDDNLLPYAVQGVRKAGVRVPEQIDIIGHTNFPMPVACDAPVLRIGFCLPDALQLAVHLIERRRAGEPVDAMVNVAASVQEECEEQLPT